MSSLIELEVELNFDTKKKVVRGHVFPQLVTALQCFLCINKDSVHVCLCNSDLYCDISCTGVSISISCVSIRGGSKGGPSFLLYEVAAIFAAIGQCQPRSRTQCHHLKQQVKQRSEHERQGVDSVDPEALYQGDWSKQQVNSRDLNARTGVKVLKCTVMIV